jgi:hypothetical protein
VVRVYQVQGDAIVGFREVTLRGSSVTAPATGPQSFAFPTLSDPDAVRDLVHVLRGTLGGAWVSPEDPGVRWTPNP